MGCRIGMATDVAARIQQLVNDGTVPGGARYGILRSNLTYEEATGLEASERAICGPYCAGHAGGGFVPGRVWSVYRVDW